MIYTAPVVLHVIAELDIPNDDQVEKCVLCLIKQPPLSVAARVFTCESRQTQAVVRPLVPVSDARAPIVTRPPPARAERPVSAVHAPQPVRTRAVVGVDQVDAGGAVPTRHAEALVLRYPTEGAAVAARAAALVADGGGSARVGPGDAGAVRAADAGAARRRVELLAEKSRVAAHTDAARKAEQVEAGGAVLAARLVAGLQGGGAARTRAVGGAGAAVGCRVADG